ncbi:MAG: HNH endonuclease signature motif containing protein, partial [Pseudoclavibacter sp.]|nr:HNH endonuclease signature motif containing protein [Pseudoclavibacter sp.]
RHAVKVNAAGHATLDGTGAIDLPTALALLPCSPDIQRVFTHPITGSVLAVDRYAPGPGLRRFLNVRDGHCRYPGCTRRAENCDADHTTPHREGGPTANSNLALLCRHHHRTKHSPGYQLRQTEDGELEWVTPAGQRLVDLPERTHLPGTLRRRVVFRPSDTRPGTVDPDVVTEPETRDGDWGAPEEPDWNDPTIRAAYLRSCDPLGNIRPEYAPTPPPRPEPEPEPAPELDEPPF